MTRKALSGMMLTPLLVGMLTSAFYIQPVKAGETVYIRADGGVDPDTAPVSSVDNVTYTFTDNIYDEIVVERSNIVVDGSGYMLQGQGIGYGFYLDNIKNVTIKRTITKKFSIGIMLNSSSFNAVSENNITDNWNGLNLSWSSNNTVSGNDITNNGWGVTLYSSSNNTIITNNITKHLYASESTPVGVQLFLSSGNTISRNNMTNNYSGVHLYQSSFNTISGNDMANNPYGTLDLSESFNNIISGNSITNNGQSVFLDSSSFNVVSENNITHNSCGVELYWSSNNNIVSGNKITNNSCGFASEGGIQVDNGRHLYLSSNNTISGNDVTNNHIGAKLYLSVSNIIYHNNFINNSQQVYDYSWDHPQFPLSTNSWDDGYPSGGNYWSNYNGTDVYNGLNQDQPGSDAVGDTPNVIDSNNRDCYPLMGPFNTFDAGTWNRVTYYIDVISNSTVSNFAFNVEQKLVGINVTGINGTVGFCRITVPNAMLGGPYVILVNDSPPLTLNEMSNGTFTFLYFTYRHSTKTVTIIGTHAVPEFRSALILLLLMVFSILSAVSIKKILRKPKDTTQKTILSTLAFTGDVAI